MCDVIAGALRAVANLLDGGPCRDQSCCPNVAWFQKQRARDVYFAFDDKTCLPPEGETPYWEPAEGEKSEPANNLVRDGAIWLSVEKGQTTKTRIRFDSARCGKNCEFEVSPDNVLSILTEEITIKQADFDIQGNDVGDATIKVTCEGKAVGWIHVACYERKTFKVAICEVNRVEKRTFFGKEFERYTLPRPRKGVDDFQTFFDDVWRDACVKVELEDIGMHELPDDLELVGDDHFFDADGQMTSPGYRSRMATKVYPVTDDIHDAVSTAHPGYDKYLYLMIPPGKRKDDKGYLNGFARGIGGDYGIFFNQGASSLSTACHEFGHLIDLRHPNDPNGADQYPDHLIAGDDNVPEFDQLNLMGYGGPRPQRKRLRYKQWKAVEGR